MCASPVHSASVRRITTSIQNTLTGNTGLHGDGTAGHAFGYGEGGNRAKNVCAVGAVGHVTDPTMTHRQLDTGSVCCGCCYLTCFAEE